MTSRFSKGLKSLGKDRRGFQEQSGLESSPRPAQVGVMVENEAALVPASYTAPSRRGKKAITAYFDPVVRQQLAMLAAEEQRSQTDLLAEALNMLFEHYGKSSIAKG